MPYSNSSFRRTIAFAAATLVVLTLFAVTPLIASDGVSSSAHSVPL